MNRRDLRAPLALAAVLLLIAGLAYYYWLHKPLTPSQAAILFSALADLFVALWLTALGGGVGRRLVAEWPGSQPGERVAVQAALGWGTLALFMLGLGFLSAYYAWALWLIALAASLWLWQSMWGWLNDARESLRAFWPADGFARYASLMTAAIFALALLRALAPPITWDALVYHLTLPKLYAVSHSLRLNIEFMFSGMPQLAEMLYTAALLLRGPVAAQALGWMFGAVLALGLASHASTLFGPRLGPLAPALVFSSFSIALALSWAYADLLLMLMGLALLILLRQWRLTRERRWLVFGGLAAGFAMGCKYTAAILPAAAGLVITVLSLHSRRAEHSKPLWHGVAPVLVFGLISFSIFAPWLIKNFVFIGNPVFPLAFPAGEMDSLRQFFYTRPDLAERNPYWAALIFVRAVFGGVQGFNDYDATLNPFLVFLPLALVLGWRWLNVEARRELVPLVIFVAAAYAAWVAFMFVSPLAVQARLFYALFPALAFVGVGGFGALAALDTSTLRVSFIVRAAFGLIVAFSAVEYGRNFIEHQPLAYLAGQQSEADYRRANLGWYALAIEKINALPEGSRVMFLWEVRALDCVSESRCLPDVIIDRWWHARRTIGSAEAALSKWQAAGATHVLVYEAGVRFLLTRPDNGYDEADWVELETLRSQLLLVEDFGGTYTLYAIP